jgi:cold shock CspA family protein
MAAQVNAGGEQLRRMDNLRVEFGICSASNGVPMASNMTLPGRIPLTLAALENRKIIGGRIYRGEMQRWNEAQGWGFIKADSDLPLPPHVQARLCRLGSDVYVRRADVAPGERLQKGLLVMFQVYIDDKGVGACGLRLI